MPFGDWDTLRFIPSVFGYATPTETPTPAPPASSVTAVVVDIENTTTSTASAALSALETIRWIRSDEVMREMRRETEQARMRSYQETLLYGQQSVQRNLHGYQQVAFDPAYYSLTEDKMPSLAYRPAARRRDEYRWTAEDKARQKRHFKQQMYRCGTHGWMHTIHLDAHEQQRNQWDNMVFSEKDREKILEFRTLRKKLGKVIASLPGSDKLSLVGEMIELSFAIHLMMCDFPHAFIDRMLVTMGAVSPAVQKYNALRTARRFVPPWFKRNWWRNSPAMYLHLIKPSTSFEGQIGYYQDAVKLGRDIVVTLKPGRYLAKYFGKGTPTGLSDTDIRTFAAEYVNAVQGRKLFMTDETTTENLSKVEKQWMDIYAHGPTSCMKGVNSVRIFANPGNHLRLAYFTYDGLPGGQPVARCIVREDVKQWLRIYPDDQGTLWQDMLNKLGAAGYARGNLDGAKLRRVDVDNDVLCPYIDEGEGGSQSVALHDDYLVCGMRGVDAAITSGYLGLSDHASCRECDDELDDDGRFWHDRGPFCSDCYSERYIRAFGPQGHEEDYYRNDCIHNRSDGQYYHLHALERFEIAQCSLTGDWYSKDELVSVEGNLVHEDNATELDVAHDGGTWAYTDSVLETTDGRTIHTDDAVQVSWRDGKDYIIHKDDDPSEELPGWKEGDKFEAIPVPVNAGKAWAEREDRDLIARFDGGMDLVALAATHRRTLGAIRARLVKYGRVSS